jgi:serine/threonine protein phosphatase 1
MLTDLLTHWDPEKELLVINGDMVDRGENPFETVKFIHEMKKSNPQSIIVLKGNHEELFLKWLDSPADYSSHYMCCGGLQTVDSFLNQRRQITELSSEVLMAEAIQTGFPEIIHFLRDLPIYHEHGKYVIVHAGVRLRDNEHWSESQSNVMLWIRDDFFSETVPNKTEKVFIFGHTPTHGIYNGSSTDIWVSNCQTKVGIDGGAVYGGTLNGLKIDIKTGTFKSIQIKHPYLKEYIDED